MAKDNITVRAHHLLCIRHFAGKGYSPGFIKNLGAVINRLKNNPYVVITNYPDDICKKCPHLSIDRCIKKGIKSERSIKNKDDKIIKWAGIGGNKRIKFKSIERLVDKKIVVLAKICNRCEWRKLCR